MFTYFFSLVIIIFEAICCNLFYDVFCKRKFEIKKKSKSFADAIIDLLLLFMRIIFV